MSQVAENVQRCGFGGVEGYDLILRVLRRWRLEGGTREERLGAFVAAQHVADVVVAASDGGVVCGSNVSASGLCMFGSIRDRGSTDMDPTATVATL